MNDRRARRCDERREGSVDHILPSSDHARWNADVRAIPLELERGHGVDRDIEQLRPAEVDDHVVGGTQDEGDPDLAARGVEAGHVQT